MADALQLNRDDSALNERILSILKDGSQPVVDVIRGCTGWHALLIDEHIARLRAQQKIVQIGRYLQLGDSHAT